MNRMEFDILILNLLENGLSDQELRQLQDILVSSPEHLERYCEFVKNYAALQVKIDSGLTLVPKGAADSKSLDMSLWQALAEQERQAETVEIRPVAQAPELIMGVREKRRQLQLPRRISRLGLYTAILGWVAMFLVIGYVIRHPRQVTLPTATLIEGVAARWQDHTFEGKAGTRLYNTDTPRQLAAGLVKIRMDSGAEILVQGPAEFCAEDTNQFYIAFGKISSIVPPGAEGFVVRTPSATVVDYGTEFGMLVEKTGRTEAHVFKGQVELRCGSDPIRHGGGRRLLAGVVTADQQLDESLRRAEQSMFIRDLSEVNGSMLDGRQLNLADIVGGGNGFGSGKVPGGIDPQTGDFRIELDAALTVNRAASHRFLAIPEFPFIDSIFTPGYDAQPTQISTTGLTCDAFGKTSGLIWGYPFNGAWHEGVGVPRHRLMLDGITPGEATGAALTLHSNLGITFDLDSIRRSLPAVVPVRLRARAGVSQTTTRFTDHDSCVVFWILVDGKVRQSQPMRVSDGGFEIDVALNSADRFVSLAVTESDSGNAYNWALFLNPRLELAVSE
ncbi:MAG TPA: FecR domain-containing protein [Anaerohalosphaeraceae bacterium]|nr:FecR domain-containing protein [Anaerohalosphaeraceae bacterium]